MSKTLTQYYHILHICKNIFGQKVNDYGASRRILHPSSLTDQIYNNASGVLNIEEKIQQLVDVKQGLVHYSNMDLIRLRKIENNKLKTLISDGINANFLVNVIYAIFALVTWSETQPCSFKIN